MLEGQADISIAAGDLVLSSDRIGLGVNVSGPQIQAAEIQCESQCYSCRMYDTRAQVVSQYVPTA